MPYVTTEDATIHYLDTGGDGPAVMLHHGFFMDGHMFDDIAAQLAPDYRVIAMDARGHGLTTDAGNPYTYWDLAWDAWAVLDELGIDRVVSGGLSQGGFIAMRMALQYPSRVTRLALMSSAATPFTVEQREAWIRKWHAHDRDRLELATWALLDHEDLTPLLDQIAQPAIVIYGNGEQSFSLTTVQELADGLGGPARLLRDFLVAPS
ncbi:alpha/beta fold hydrolase [Nocardia sp. NPDC020380]|uniref:alpha/beta fold hydrolase n=1 Tax=Nocardia sp. NPDC020380 TaxID=3364309 RepID=UPI0037957ABB